MQLQIKQTQFEKDMASEHRQLFLQVRQLLLGIDGMTETQKERITTYSDTNGSICHMRTTKTGVDIGYLKGAKLIDRFGLLQGKTKKMRVQKLLSADELNKEAVLDYITQSMLLNGS